MNLQEAISALQSAVEEVIKSALLDDMTPLGNAQALKLKTSSVGKGGDTPDVVIFGDLNRLKGLNDQFGHAVGSAAIGEVGKLIKSLFVDECGAQAFRQSGDEFVVLLSSQLLEQFKDRVASFASLSFQIEDETHSTAMSFGYAASLGETDFATLVARAEIACQLAKHQGDGYCVEWSEEIERQVRDSSRGRCKHCGAWFTCSVPRQTVPVNKVSLWCPCCGRSLGSVESAITEQP